MTNEEYTIQRLLDGPRWIVRWWDDLQGCYRYETLTNEAAMREFRTDMRNENARGIQTYTLTPKRISVG